MWNANKLWNSKLVIYSIRMGACIFFFCTLVAMTPSPWPARRIADSSKTGHFRPINGLLGHYDGDWYDNPETGGGVRMHMGEMCLINQASSSQLEWILNTYNPVYIILFYLFFFNNSLVFLFFSFREETSKVNNSKMLLYHSERDCLITCTNQITIKSL